MNIRSTLAGDIPDLQTVVEQTELFPKEMLPQLLMDYLQNDGCSQVWLTCEIEGKALGFCFAEPEELTSGTWNMRAIAVVPSHQGNSLGSSILGELERELKAKGQRILIVDTSGLDVFRKTRSFYAKNGFTEEARIRDFWAKGDDKVVFWKAL